MSFSKPKKSLKHRLKYILPYFPNILLHNANEKALTKQHLKTRVMVTLQTHEPKNTSSHNFSPT